MTHKHCSFFFLVLTLFASMFMTSCSKQGDKEVFINLSPVTFLNNIPGDIGIDIYYEGDLVQDNMRSMATIRVKANANGKFVIKDAAADTLLLETEIETGNLADTVYVFRLSPEDQVGAIRYVKGMEPAPREGYVKFKIANTARLTTADKIDIVFKQNDPLTGEVIRVDSIIGITRNFPDEYVEIKHGYIEDIYPNRSYSLEFRNTETGEFIRTRNGLLAGGAIEIDPSHIGIYTLYLKEDQQPRCANNNIEVNGICYRLSFGYLFTE